MNNLDSALITRAQKRDTSCISFDKNKTPANSTGVSFRVHLEQTQGATLIHIEG